MSDIVTITVNSKAYPKLLREISNIPQKMYARGNIELLHTNCLAVVGTRANSAEGEANTRSFIRGLVSYNLTIVSGLAFGIDAIAHESTLTNGGKTIAVLGSGIDNIRPASNEHLARAILKQGGLILSEYPPKSETKAYHYPARNRLISGLSVGTLIIEAPDKSGASITAKYAFEQNREVFAIPGALSQETMRGNNNLIAGEVARLVRSPEDIIVHLREQPALLIHGDLKPISFAPPSFTFKTAAQKQVFAFLQKHHNTPLYPDAILNQTNLSVPEVSVALSYLEITGHIQRTNHGQYVYNTCVTL